MASGGALIGALRVTLGLDSAQFEAGTKRARAVAQRDVSAIQKTLNGVVGGFKALAGAALAVGLMDAAKRSLDYAASLAEVSQQLGVTTRDLQVYRFIATQVGVEQGEMDKGLQRLTRTIGEAADGSKKQSAAFRELGVSVQDSSGRLYTAGEVIPRIADALSKIEDPARRARLETALFGKAGQQLDPLLTEGSKGIQAMADEAEKLGLIMGDDLIKKADAAADRLSVLSKVLEVELASTVAEGADGILMFANAFISLVSGIGDAISWLRKFGYEARQTINAAQGWTPFGGRASGEAGYKARARYFMEGVAADEEERQRKATGNTARNARLRPAPIPSAGGGTRGRGGARASSGRAEAEAERSLRDLNRLRGEQLSLESRRTSDIREQARIEHEQINLAEREALDEIEKGDAHRAEKEALIKRNAIIQHTLANWQLDDEITEQELALRRSALDNQQELLRGDLDAARTQSDRRRIQLAILDLEQQEERAALEAVQAKHKSTDVEYQIAQSRLDQLGIEAGQRAGAIRRDTMGPMESYLDSLPRTADELRERFESIKVDALNNGLDVATRNVVKLKGVAGDLFNQLINDVIRLNLQSALTGGGGGLLGSLGKLLGMASSTATATSANSTLSGIGAGMVPKMAGGGSFNVGGVPGVDRNVLAVNGIPRAMVSANENVRVGYGGVGSGPIVIQMEEGALFRPVVRSEAAGVSIQTTRASNTAGYRRSRSRLA